MRDQEAFFNSRYGKKLFNELINISDKLKKIFFLMIAKNNIFCEEEVSEKERGHKSSYNVRTLMFHLRI